MMSQHHSSYEHADYFHLLESDSILVVKDIKEEIQGVLNSGSEPKFVNSLLDYFIRTNSREALDLISGIREPHDKHLLDRLNEYLKQPSTVLPSLTVLGSLIQRQPSWLYKIFKAPVFHSVIKLLKVDTSVPVLMSGVLSITTLLPIYPSLVSPYLNDIFHLFSRLAAWNIQKPGNVPEIYMLHLNVAVYGLFHRLYGMYPCNFVDFLKVSYKDKTKEFNKAILVAAMYINCLLHLALKESVFTIQDYHIFIIRHNLQKIAKRFSTSCDVTIQQSQPLLERMRIHPRLITDTYNKEIDASRWRKMEAHDVLMECAKVSLDYSLDCRESESLNSYSVSEYRNMTSCLKQYLQKGQRPTSSPIISVSTIDNTNHPELDNLVQSGAVETLHHRVQRTENSDQSWFSPSQMCPLSTPPLSRPSSPTISHADISMTSSSFVGSMITPAANTPTPQITPGGSPRPFVADDLRCRLAHISSGKSGKLKPAFQKQISITSLNSSSTTPSKMSEGSKSVPVTPYKKTNSFEFPSVNISTPSSASKLKISDHELGKKDSRKLEKTAENNDSFEEIKLPEQQMSEFSKSSKCHLSAEPVSIKRLKGVIEQLSPDNGTNLDEDGINKELSLIVNSEEDSPLDECLLPDHMAFSYDRWDGIARMHYNSESEAYQGYRSMSRTRHETYPPLWRFNDSEMSGIHEKLLRSDCDSKDEQSKNISAIVGHLKADDVETDNAQLDTINQRTVSAGGNIDIKMNDVEKSADVAGSQVINTCEGNLEFDSKENIKSYKDHTAKSVGVQQIYEGNQPSVPVSQRFTPIKDRSVESLESPLNTQSTRSSTSDYPSVSGYHSGTTTADLRSPHLNNAYMQIFPNMVSPLVNPYQKQSSSTNSTPACQGSIDGFRTPNDMSGRLSWHSPLSPPQLLDQYIERGDNVHSNELSRIPLTSQSDIKWTHFGGRPPADEIELLKGQVFLLHIQLQFERNQREQHEQRNRRLLRKTHKAKAFEEQNSALQMQLKQDQREKQELLYECKQIRNERDELSAMCEAMKKDLGLERGKNTVMIRELQEAKEELQKLLVEHKQEVERIKKDWKVAEDRVCVLETEKENLLAEVAIKKQLEGDVDFLNRQLLLMGEVNMKYQNKMDDEKEYQMGKDELEMYKKASRKELHGLMDTYKQKSLQLEAAKSRVGELEQAREQQELSIIEQKRYLESVKSLSNAKMTAMETRVKSFKKIIQRQESFIFKLQKQILEIQGDSLEQSSNKSLKNSRRQSNSSRTSNVTSGASTPEVIMQERLQHVPNSEEAIDEAMYSMTSSETSNISMSKRYSLKEETTLNLDKRILSGNELKTEIPGIKDIEPRQLMSSPPISFSETSPFRRVEPRSKSQVTNLTNFHQKSNSLPRTFKETSSKKKSDIVKSNEFETSSSKENTQDCSNDTI